MSYNLFSFLFFFLLPDTELKVQSEPLIVKCLKFGGWTVGRHLAATACLCRHLMKLKAPHKDCRRTPTYLPALCFIIQRLLNLFDSQ